VVAVGRFHPEAAALMPPALLLLLLASAAAAPAGAPLRVLNPRRLPPSLPAEPIVLPGATRGG